MRNIFKYISTDTIDFRNFKEKENDFKRLATINLIVALFITPIFSLFVYHSNIPKVYFYLSLSYTILFPIYISICWLIPFLRNKLFYFFVFQLFGMTFFAYINLIESGFDVISLFSFFSLFSLTLLVIQRFTFGIIYIIYVFLSLFLGFYFVDEPMLISKNLIIGFFICISLSGLFVYYLRNQILKSLEDLASYLSKLSQGNTFGFFLFSIIDTKVVIQYFDNIAAKKISNTYTNSKESLSNLFNERLSTSDLIRLQSLNNDAYFLKQISIDDRHYELMLSPILLHKKKFYIIKSNDITNRVKEREKLINSEKRYKKLYNDNQSGVFTINENLTIIDCNSKFKKQFENFYKIGDTIDLNDHLLDIIYEEQHLNNYQTHYVLRNGLIKWFIFNFYYDVENNLIEGNVIDITELQKTTNALRKSEEKFKTLYEKSNDAIVVIENDKIIDVNLKCMQLFGMSKSDLLNSYLWELSDGFDDQKERLINQYQKKLSDTGTIKFDWIFKGRYFPIETEVMLTEISIGTSSFLQVIIHDVTEMNQNIRALKTSSENLHSVLESTPEGILIIQNNTILYANKQVFSLYESNDIAFEHLFIEEDQSVFLTELENKLTTSSNVYKTFTIQSATKQKQVDVILVDTSYQYEGAILLILKDISLEHELSKEVLRAEVAEEHSKNLQIEIQERIKTERELKNLLLKTKSIYNSSDQLILFSMDTNFNIVSFNQHGLDYYYNILGRKAEFGMSMNDYFDPLYTDQVPAIDHGKRINQVITTGTSINFEYEFSYNNQFYCLHTFINPIFDIDNNLSEIVFLSHDISAKKKTEIEIVNSLREKDVLLKEIHHRVKNNLQVISSILNLQSAYVKDKETLNVLLESRNRIRSMSIIHENLYSTDDLSSINFSSYIRNLTSNIMAVYYNKDISVKVIFDLDSVKLTIDQAVPCGLILNELITNAYKYAFTGKQDVNDLFITFKQVDNKVNFSVKDTGIGLPNDFIIENSDTLGLQLVVTLVDQLDATLSYKIDGGTEFLISFELI